MKKKDLEQEKTSFRTDSGYEEFGERKRDGPADEKALEKKKMLKKQSVDGYKKHQKADLESTSMEKPPAEKPVTEKPPAEKPPAEKPIPENPVAVKTDFEQSDFFQEEAPKEHRSRQREERLRPRQRKTEHWDGSDAAVKSQNGKTKGMKNGKVKPNLKRKNLGDGFYTFVDVGEATVDKSTGEKDDFSGASDIANDGGRFVEVFGRQVGQERRRLIDDLYVETKQNMAEVWGSIKETAFGKGEKSQSSKAQKKKRHKQAQKRRIKREYATNLRTTGMATKTQEVAKKGKEAESAAKRIWDVATSGGKHLLVILCAILILLVVLIGGVTVSLPLMSSVMGATQSSGYQSTPAQIDKAELDLSYREARLQMEIDNVETSHRGYDEYAYSLGPIGHDPRTLINYLSAVYGKIERRALNEIESLFNESYTLTYTPVDETRTRVVIKYRTVTKTRMVTKTRIVTKTRLEMDPRTGALVEVEYQEEEEYEEEEEYQDVEAYEDIEEYTVHVLKTVLTVTPLENIVERKLLSNPEAAAMYSIYQRTYGLVQVFLSPVDSRWTDHVCSKYGYRKNPSTEAWELHRGVDVTLPSGSRIFPAMDGTVVEVANSTDYGTYVSIANDQGFIIRYARLNGTYVSVGDVVTHDQVIGLSGGVGTALGSHLHMELLYNGGYLDPLFYLSGSR